MFGKFEVTADGGENSFHFPGPQQAWSTSTNVKRINRDFRQIVDPHGNFSLETLHQF
jgi:hypothetical protein